MTDLKRIEQVSYINELKGVETKHPLVTAFDYKNATIGHYPEGGLCLRCIYDVF
ncbi:MAG: hypothetical protein ACK5JS_05230 [Mangrovibacterium sp.]